jgi:ribonuclease R
MPEIARHTSERERRADDAERELVQWKKVRFMADKVGDEFEGYVTGVSAFGLYIELVEHFVEGMVHVSTMADDYYRFIERAHVLKGETSGRVYRLGDKVEVQVVRVDLERRQVDLGLTEILEAVRLKERGRSGRRAATAEARGPRPKDRGRDKGRAAEREARKPGKTERRRKTRAGRRERLAKKRGR